MVWLTNRKGGTCEKAGRAALQSYPIGGTGQLTAGAPVQRWFLATRANKKPQELADSQGR
ncbi:hypothetical protein [Acetobacterium woodii]|uniref:Uncharacterized protein n=1 Tax=Acetobacterium woodii (strain ATCC 29683 / DSM 1030 / JCM 2381 / KCTC 1655 / WB1) TaxID=931626 RepID=H6LIQ9_ACEWD|nr:hypothetical protein [Acetobacterium woodii]AFA49798.1 hypothetical protein Awo_c30700 [Acetobacterium woodii DSM 1030]